MEIIDEGDLIIFRDTATDVTIRKDKVRDILYEADYVYIFYTSTIRSFSDSISSQFDPLSNDPVVEYSRGFRVDYNTVDTPQTFASVTALLDYIYDLFATTPRIEYYEVPDSDLDTELTATRLRYAPAPYDMEILDVVIQVDSNYVPTGASLIGDIEIAGQSIFTTRPAIDAGETNSTTGTAAVLPTTTVAQYTQMDFYTDQVGSTYGGAGLVFILKVKRI